MGPEDREDFDTEVFGDSVGFSRSDREGGGSHSTVWDRDSNSRMSWDTDAKGNYAGGGHSVDQDKGTISPWD